MMNLWRPVHQAEVQTLTEEVHYWLCETQSLTQQLKMHFDNDFQVDVVAEVWQRPALDEARLLQMRMGVSAFVRQVYLICRNQPLVYARTVMPQTVFHGTARQLQHLGSRSLGEVLFTDPKVRRGELQIAKLTSAEPLYHDAVMRLEPPWPIFLWGRRSLFFFDDKSILVTEIFLPGLFHSRKNDSSI